MPDIATLGLFALACLALTSTPGPDMLLIATRRASQGKLAGLATYLGIATGTYCHALALALGLSQLFLAIPMAYDMVRYIGAAYLLYLAWQAIKSNHQIQDGDKNRKQYSPLTMYRQGFLTNALNPKVALFFLALFPQFLEPELGFLGLQVMILATILNVIGFLVNGLVIVTVVKSTAAILKNSWVGKITPYFTGVVFTALAVRLALDDSR